MQKQLVLTILADDQPGVVEQIASIIINHKGNWTQSSMSRLGGKFAGILLADINSQNDSALQEALLNLNNQGIKVTIESALATKVKEQKTVQIEIVANDRLGIIGEISTLCANKNINLESLESCCESAPMSASMLFRAHASVRLPAGMSDNQLRALLEELSSDLMVEIIN
jgi:glycine cleavage system regulatory protein